MISSTHSQSSDREIYDALYPPILTLELVLQVFFWLSIYILVKSIFCNIVLSLLTPFFSVRTMMRKDQLALTLTIRLSTPRLHTLSRNTRRSPSAVHKLPVELWRAVFQSAVSNLSSTKQLESMKLASVCKYWRKIAMDFPELWDTVVFDVDRALCLDLISLLIHRSSSRGLHVSIRRRDGYPQSLLASAEKEEASRTLHFLNALKYHFNRVKSLRVEVCGSLTIAHVLRSYLGLAGDLEELALVCHQPVREWREADGTTRTGYTAWNPVALRIMPLQKLTLTAAPPLRPQALTAFTNIRSLSLMFPNGEQTFDPSVMLSMLAPLKSLSQLKLDGSSGPISIHPPSNLRYPVTIFELPVLQDLYIDTIAPDFTVHFLTHANMPALKQLDITGLRLEMMPGRIFGYLNAPAYLNASGGAPCLDTLCLRQIGPGVLATIIPHLNFCKHLKLYQAGALDDVQMSALCTPQGLTATWFVPKLISLELSHANLVSVQALRAVVHGRKMAALQNADGPLPAALQDMRVYHDGRLGVVDRTWFRENVSRFYWGPQTQLRG